MFARFINKYRTWRLTTTLDSYDLALQDILMLTTKPEEYPVKLKEFWRHFDMSLLDDLSVRDTMGYTHALRHRTFPQLHQLFIEANDAIANERDTRLDYAVRTGLMAQADVSMDTYFRDPIHGPLDIKESIEELKLLLQAHCGILENIEGTYGQRKMLHAYYDVAVLSEVLVELIRGRGVTSRK